VVILFVVRKVLLVPVILGLLVFENFLVLVQNHKRLSCRCIFGTLLAQV